MRQLRSALAYLALLLAVLLLAAACGGDAVDEAAPEEEPVEEPGDEAEEEGDEADEPAEPEHLVLALASPGIPFLQVDVAEEMGFYADHNLEVDWLEVDGSAAATAAVESGEADILISLPEGVITARAAGSTMTMIGATVNETLYRLYVTEDIETLEDLAGQRIAMFIEGNGTHIQPMWLLDEHGAGADQTTFIATGGLGDRLAALIEGQVEGTFLFPPFDAQASAQGFDYVADMRDYVDGYPNEVIAARREALDEKPEAFRAFMAAFEDATQWIIDNPEEAIDLAVEVTGGEPDLVAEAFEYTLPTFGTSIPEEGLEWTLEVMERYLEGVDELPTIDELYDPSFLPNG